MQAGIIAAIGSILAVLVSALAGVFLFYRGKSIERQMVNKAILAEIKRLLAILPNHRDWLKECKISGNLDLPLIPFTTPIYDEHAKNIGMLDNEFVAKAASFYGYLQFLNALQKSRSDYLAVKKLQEFYDMYLRSLNTACDTYQKAFDGAFKLYELT